MFFVFRRKPEESVSGVNVKEKKKILVRIIMIKVFTIFFPLTGTTRTDKLSEKKDKKVFWKFCVTMINVKLDNFLRV